jgi:hypothetical protein
MSYRGRGSFSMNYEAIDEKTYSQHTCRCFNAVSGIYDSPLCNMILKALLDPHWRKFVKQNARRDVKAGNVQGSEPRRLPPRFPQYR